ncbi:MAG: ComEA family DNA-binding protein [Myxococcales bacterium]|nr:ComEA family DNA-binding protein [Myxococcales bacterium]
MIVWLFFIASALAAVDVNTADSTALESLPGIGPGKASAILAYRNEHGPFLSLSDLDNVEGIGPSTLVNLKDMVSFSANSPANRQESPQAAVPPSPVTLGAASSCAVNINLGDAAALEALPGIGPSKAAAILQYRTDHGPFATCDGLDDVSGIGRSTIATLRSCCVTK